MDNLHASATPGTMRERKVCRDCHCRKIPVSDLHKTCWACQAATVAAVAKTGEGDTRLCDVCLCRTMPNSDSHTTCVVCREYWSSWRQKKTAAAAQVNETSEDGTRICPRCWISTIPVSDSHVTCATCRENRRLERQRKIAAAALVVGRSENTNGGTEVSRRELRHQTSGDATAPSTTCSNEESHIGISDMSAAGGAAAGPGRKVDERSRDENWNINNDETRKNNKEVARSRTKGYAPVPLADRPAIQNEVGERTQEPDSQTKALNAKTAKAAKPAAAPVHQRGHSLPAQAWQYGIVDACDPAAADGMRSERLHVHAKRSALPITRREEPRTKETEQEDVTGNHSGEVKQHDEPTKARFAGTVTPDKDLFEVADALLLLSEKHVLFSRTNSVMSGLSVNPERHEEEDHATSQKQPVVVEPVQNECAPRPDTTSLHVAEALLMLSKQPIVFHHGGSSIDYERWARQELERL
ncbi:hypothetical protein OE88DRAFT_926475 [Heliocybe sulcata]|uniref:Uncharacterized protein n=1 Tax=Heliocybe sulcata TaxID=5364 RepID=A0A5C3MN17_9AGAM|nr:hypothetical protein OE88DRAFT_926475 [Heliocybe sulcata]